MTINTNSLLQASLNQLTHSKLAVDGVIGQFTLLAIASLSSDNMRVFRRVMDLFDIEIPSAVSYNDVLETCRQIARSVGVPPSYMDLVLPLENYVNEGIIKINNSGDYQGIGQFDRATWQSVSIVPYTSVSSIMHSARAICELYKRNLVSFVVQSHASRHWNDKLAYLYHNQGAGSAHKYLENHVLVYPDQSEKALVVFEAAYGAYHENFDWSFKKALRPY